MFNNPLSIVDPTGMDGSDGLPNTNADLDDKDNLFDWTSKDGKKKEEKKKNPNPKPKADQKPSDLVGQIEKMLFDTENSGVEQAALILFDGEKHSIVIFDDAHNTSGESWLPSDVKTNKDGSFEYDGKKVVGDIHTHPSGSVKPSEKDEASISSQKPGIIIGKSQALLLTYNNQIPDRPIREKIVLGESMKQRESIIKVVNVIKGLR